MDDLYSYYHVNFLFKLNIKKLQTKAQELELSCKGFSYDFLNKKADKLNQAAKMYIKIGQFERFCECQIKNGDFNTF